MGNEQLAVNNVQWIDNNERLVMNNEKARKLQSSAESPLILICKYSKLL